MRQILTRTIAGSLGALALLAALLVSRTGWAQLPDAQVTRQIVDVLNQNGLLTGNDIAVRYAGGTAWLNGRVNSHGQLLTAAEIAQASPHVTRVINELRVQFPGAVRPVSHQSLAPEDAVLQAPVVQFVGSAPTIALPEPPVTEEPQRKSLWNVSLDIVKKLNPLAKSEESNPPPSSRPKRAQPLFAAVRPATPVRAAIPVRSVDPPPVRTATPAPVRAVAPVISRPAPSQNRVTPAPAQNLIPRSVVSPGAPRPALVRVARAPVPIAPSSLPGAVAPMAMRAAMGAQPGPQPAYVPGTGGGVAPASYDQPHLPGYAWPSYAPYPNYSALTYPKQYSPTAWPYIGPFYPYPQVPLGWRKVSLEWDDGWWQLDFKD